MDVKLILMSSGMWREAPADFWAMLGGTVRSLIGGLALLAAIAAMTAGAQAQSNSPSSTAAHIGERAARNRDVDEPKVKVNDKAYNAALKNLPDKRYDPWHGVR